MESVINETSVSVAVDVIVLVCLAALLVIAYRIVKRFK